MNGLLLAHHALLQALLHVDELLPPRLPSCGETGMPVQLATTSAMSSSSTSSLSILSAALQLRQGRLLFLQLLLQIRRASVANLGGLGQIARPLRRSASSFLSSSIRPRMDWIRLITSRSLDQCFFILVALCLELRHLVLELPATLQRAGVRLAFQGLRSISSCMILRSRVVDLGGQAVDLDPQVRGRLVDKVDGLVRQEPVGDVAVRQGGRGHDAPNP